MKNLLLCSVILVGMMFPACHKNKITKIPVNAALKAAFNYQPGTYWIYRDSISGEVDSFFVTSEQDGYGDIPNGNNPSTTSVEYIWVFISDYNISQSPIVDSQRWEFTYTANGIYLSYDSSQIELYPLIDYPFNSTINGIYYGLQADSLIVINIYSSFILNGQAFTNVAVVNHQAYNGLPGNLTYSNFYTDQFYICPSSGIIKMNLNHPQDNVYRIWELQRCMIKL